MHGVPLAYVNIESSKYRVYNGSIFTIQSSALIGSVTAIINDDFYFTNFRGGDLAIGQSKSENMVTYYEPVSASNILMYWGTLTIVLEDCDSFMGNITAESGYIVTSTISDNFTAYEAILLPKNAVVSIGNDLLTNLNDVMAIVWDS